MYTLQSVNNSLIRVNGQDYIRGTLGYEAYSDGGNPSFVLVYLMDGNGKNILIPQTPINEIEINGDVDNTLVEFVDWFRANAYQISVGDSITNPVIVQGRSSGIRRVAFNRPSDTIQYASGDAINSATTNAAALQFSGIFGSAGGSAYVNAIVHCSNQTVVPKLRLHLFSTNLSADTNVNDNVVLTIASADRNKWLGFIEFDNLLNGRTTSLRPLLIEAPGANVWGVLTTSEVFTPASGTEYIVGLIADLV